MLNLWKSYALLGCLLLFFEAFAVETDNDKLEKETGRLSPHQIRDPERISYPQKSKSISEFYTEDIKSDLFFCSVKLSKDNFKYWGNYVVESNTLCDQYKNRETQYPKSIKYSCLGIEGFYKTIDHWRNSPVRNSYDLWVVFATVEKPDASKLPGFSRIEMCYTLATSPNAPFSSHMGIFRGPIMTDYLLNHPNSKLKMHQNIAMDLHAFGARFLKRIFPDKLYMITTPVLSMTDLMERELGRENIKIAWDKTWEDFMENCKVFKRLQEKFKQDPRSSKCYELSQYLDIVYKYSKRSDEKSAPMVFAKKFSPFILKNQNGETVFDLSNSSTQIQIELSWYTGNILYDSTNPTVVIDLDYLANFNKQG